MSEAVHSLGHAALVSVGVWVLVFFTAHALPSELSPTVNAVSEYANFSLSPSTAPFIIGCWWILSLTVVLEGVALQLTLTSPPYPSSLTNDGNIGASFIYLFAIATLVMSFFPTDRGRRLGRPRGAEVEVRVMAPPLGLTERRQKDIEHQLHIFCEAIGAVSVIVGTHYLSSALWKKHCSGSVLCENGALLISLSYFVLAGNLTKILFVVLSYHGKVHVFGLFERIGYFANLLWLATVAVLLVK